jgi:hypothetical protein
MQKLPVICPSCATTLSVSQLTCAHCETSVSGHYLLPVFLRLTPEEQSFVMDFIISGGSLKEMANKLGKSYPTVRNLLDEIIVKLNPITK